jgi:hypothetical protein
MKPLHAPKSQNDLVDQLRTLTVDEAASIALLAKIRQENHNPLYDPLLDKFARAHHIILRAAQNLLGIVQDLEPSTLHPSR